MNIWQTLRATRKEKGDPIEWTLRSYIPEKYLLVDTETGDIWRYIVDGEGRVGTKRFDMTKVGD